jgi:type IV pilus assembly protein PilB
MDILQTLIQKGFLDEKRAEELKTESEKTGLTIEQVLIKDGVPAQQILESKGEYFDVPTKSIDPGEISDKVLNYIPEESAKHYRMAAFDVSDNVLQVGMVDPDDIEARDALNFISTKSGLPFKIYLISQDDLDKIIPLYKGLSGEVSKALTELETELKSESVTQRGQEIKPENEKITEDAPVTKIVATILRYATDGNASDIHIEPWRESVKVRFRVDGTMHTSLTLPSKVQEALVARIKILTNSMKLDEKRKPQDGRFSARIEGRKIDFRVSTLPTYFGEKVVMRLLDQEKGVKKLEELGISDRNLRLIKEGIEKPYGLILISGPTGSGKTTTLYSMLNEVDRDGHNVISLEDPIEYNMEGISQSQVHSEIGYTFASGLRTILRQDPDIIMVGEIRDKETAQLAIQAALTGHLVFSTIHTNSATGVIPRLVDMGVDPYLIAPTLVLAIAQRLVRKLCPNSGTPVPIEGSMEVMIQKQFADLPKKYLDELSFTKEVYKLSPSKECPNGTRGRLAVIEVMEMDKDLEAVILKNPTEVEIAKCVRAKGMTTMREDAILKAMHRDIPFEEVNAL